jgi:hypothetical protein
VPKNPELVEVQIINRLDAILEPAQSKLGVVEVGLHVRIKRLHRFDAEVATGKHRTEFGCKFNDLAFTRLLPSNILA